MGSFIHVLSTVKIFSSLGTFTFLFVLQVQGPECFLCIPLDIVLLNTHIKNAVLKSTLTVLVGPHMISRLFCGDSV